MTALADLMDGTDAEIARSAYTLLSEFKACPERRAAWLRRRLHIEDSQQRLDAAADLIQIEVAEDGEDVLVAFLELPLAVDDDQRKYAHVAAEVLLSSGKRVERAVAALRSLAALGPDSDSMEAAITLKRYGYADAALGKHLQACLSKLEDEDGYLGSQIKSLLNEMGVAVLPLSPDVVIERQLRILASAESEHQRTAAWQRIRGELRAIAGKSSVAWVAKRRDEAWWPRASRSTARAAGLAEQLADLPTRIAEILLRLALPDAPKQLLPWLLRPRSTLPSHLSTDLGRLVSAEGKDKVGRFASAFWFSYLKLPLC